MGIRGTRFSAFKSVGRWRQRGCLRNGPNPEMLFLNPSWFSVLWRSHSHLRARRCWRTCLGTTSILLCRCEGALLTMRPQPGFWWVSHLFRIIGYYWLALRKHRLYYYHTLHKVQSCSYPFFTGPYHNCEESRVDSITHWEHAWSPVGSKMAPERCPCPGPWGLWMCMLYGKRRLRLPISWL